jgi:hypothetical protein
MSEDYENKMIEAFINKDEKTLWYQDAFSKFNVNGVDVMRWNWSWWAFGTGFLFLLYRKQYLPSLVLFILSVTIGTLPFITLILMILSGGYAPYFIYKGYKQKKEEIEAKIDDEELRIQTMREVGGYHQWVVWLYIAITVVTFVSAYIFIGASSL